MAKQAKKVIDTRIQQLKDLGFGLSIDEKNWVNGATLISVIEVDTLSKNEWDKIISEFHEDKPKEKTPQNIAIINGPNNSTNETVKPETALEKVEFSKIELTEDEYNQYTPIIKNWENYCLSLKITGLTDNKTYQAVKEAKSLTRKTRTTLKKVADEKKEFHLAEQRRINGILNKFNSSIEIPENYLDKQLDQWDQWKKEDDDRKEQEAQAETTRRVEALKEAGMVFNGSYYILGEMMSFDIVSIKAMTPFDFDVRIEKVKLEKARLDKLAVDELLRKEQEEKEQREKQEAFEKQERELKEKQDAFAKQQKEMEEQKETMRRQKITMRENMAKAIGLVFEAYRTSYVFKNEFFEAKITQQMISDMDDAIYSAQIDTFSFQIIEAKQKVEDKTARETKKKQLFESRSMQLISLGMKKGDDKFYFSLPNVFNKTAIISFDDLERDDFEAAELWNTKIQGLTEFINEIKADQEVFEKREKQKEVEYQERQTDLINLGMAIIGPSFIIKNEFNDIASISIEFVKSIDHDNWSSNLTTIKENVDEVKRKTELKRADIAKQKEALKPEIQRCTEIINKVWDVLKDTSSSSFNDEKISQIYKDFNQDIYNKVNHYLGKIVELQK